MSSGRRGPSAFRRDERGMTLIELLLAALMGLVVIGGAFTMFAGAIHSQPRDSAKVTALQEARTTLDRITRELRQGIVVVPNSPTISGLAIVTYVKQATCGGAAASTAIPCRVTYSCSGTSCTRFVSQPNGSAPGPTTTVVSGLTSTSVFTYSPNETEVGYVGVSFSIAGSGRPFVLSDGVTLRNPGDEA